MELANLVKNHTIYLISNELKEEILTYINKEKLLLDIHFFSLNEFIKRCYFTYSDEAIYQVSKNFNLSFDNAKIMIDNLKYLMYGKESKDKNYLYLKEIKDFLDKKDLLKYDLQFLDYLNRYKIVSDLVIDNEFFAKINELLNNKIEFLAIEKKEKATVYKFKDIEDEVEYLANEISDLLNNNIEINKIHILNYSNTYYPYIDKIFSLYNLPYTLANNNYLFEIKKVKELYQDYLLNKEITPDGDLEIRFLEILNSLDFISETKDKAEFLLYKLKTSKDRENRYLNCLNFSSYNSYYLPDHYYFFIGLNNKEFPLYKKDEDYLSDKIKEEIGYLPSYKINSLIKTYYQEHLLTQTNLFLSYKEIDYFNEYLKSDLLDTISEETTLTIVNNYSKEYDYLKLAKHLDNYYKYDLKSDKLFDLLTKLDKKDYKSYSHSYTGVDNSYYLDKILNNHLSVSYSSLERFYECYYKYYLDSILKEREDKFTTYLGSLVHYILEKIYDRDFDFDKRVSEYQSEYILNEKEKILLPNLLTDLKEKIKIILDQYNRGNYKRVKREENISLKKKTSLSINITGYLDKLMLDDFNHGYVVDYKTGDTKLTLDYLDYGLKCQLPFYFYLLSQSEEYANVYLVACYLQIINFKLKRCDDKSKELLLDGFTLNDEEIVAGIDNFYNEDSFIKGIKPNSKGLGTYAKLINETALKAIIEKMDHNILEMIDNIEKTNFLINPKILKNKETTCQYCKYKDICYHDYNDYLDLKGVGEDGVDE